MRGPLLFRGHMFFGLVVVDYDYSFLRYGKKLKP
jgi:hypothetical protein